MNEKIRKVGLILLSAVLSVCLLCGLWAMLGRQTTAYAAVVEDNVVCRASTDDNFEDNKILVTLKPEYSKFNKLPSGVEKKIFKLGGVQIENLSEFPASYVRADGTLNPKTAPSLTEYYKSTPFKQSLAITLNKSDKQNVLDTIKQIEMLDEVLCANPNMIEKAEYVPSDSLYYIQWSLNNTQGIHAQDAWDITRGSGNVRVGVIDTGIASHYDLDANVVQGKDFYNNNLITSDDESGHGTGVAGIIGAISNSQGISGIAPNTKMVPLQASYWDTQEKDYLLTSQARARAIQYAIDLWENTATRISVLNHSVGGFGTDTYLLSYISNYPGLFVWSAGNAGYNVDNYADISKFKLDNLIAVGAINNSNERSVWNSTQSSNYGINVDIYAPGGEGESFDYLKNIMTTSKSDNAYCMFSGTSAAAPHVTGVAALLLSQDPTLTAAELKEIILSKADDITISTPDGNQKVKKLNAYKAVKSVESSGRDYFTVTLHSEGNKTSDKVITLKYGEQLPEFFAPEKTGYAFDGYYDANGKKYYGMEVKNDPQTAQLNAVDYAYKEFAVPVAGTVWDKHRDTTLYGRWDTTPFECNHVYLSYCGSERIGGGNVHLTHGDTKISPAPIDGYSFNHFEYLNKSYSANESIPVILYRGLSNNIHLEGEIKAYYDKSCLAEGSLITLADGSQVAVENLTGNEMLLVWNLHTGTYDTAPILFIDSDPLQWYRVINLSFSDGTTVKVISEHGFWDYDLNKYVYLDENAENYIGHWFNKGDGRVQLVDVEINEEYTTAWSPVTYGHLCYFVNGMLSMPGGIDGLFNIFEVDAETMKYDEALMQLDIETYGLFTYEEFCEYFYLPEEAFEAFNGQYLKVAIGKGLITMEQLAWLYDRYSGFLG